MRLLGFVGLVVICPLLLSGSALPEDEGDVWRYAGAEDGVSVLDFMKIIHETTGETILFNPFDPSMRAKRIALSGPVSVPRDRVFDWFRSTLVYQKLVLVPIGPVGGRMWALMNRSDLAIANYPTHVLAEDLEKWADRDGAFIMCVLVMRHVEDTTRARNALANLVTRPTGRLCSLPGTRALIVADYAPVVCNMARMLKEMDVEVPEPKAPPPPPPSVAERERAQKIAQYEQKLVGSRTEAAAEYFLERLRALQSRKAVKVR